MYGVKFVITPINYATGFSKAIRQHNERGPKNTLEELEAKILATLMAFNRGMRERPLMMQATGRINRQRMLFALARLQSHNYIQRVQIKNKVLYCITTEGRNVVDDLNDRIIKIAEADARAIAEGRV